ncbi:3-oxoacyl-[acyl-carrier protein] reductase [Sporobacter termitidis DSM 10068]|uniref:3-oxoacyl-[acyl-carrier protein] reductase n=1 Tax=Sporobacter termitidis DSM 10068 TaxID=1123282 RepID=A0A1M5YXA2_9FIRM|nr:SDR family NAD(P)-dependent oxidoreductase [Sporobacter termitidis]SHI16478.1 3-oxoacyl-[acyl-carrier protein] reductase [Sporobacter termitidis DSM 10068]
MGNHLSGKVALVTGSGQGIGRAIALALAAEGAKVITNNRSPVKVNVTNQLDEARLARLTPEQLDWYNKEIEKYSGDAETTAAAIRAAGGEATAFFGDLSDFNMAKKMVDFTVDTYGSIDIIVNVAGAFGFAPVEKITEELWDRVTTVKPKGFFNIIHHAVPYMKKKGWGRIINCASPAWTGGDLRQCEYCAANAGVVGMTWGLATELAENNITCNVFAPAAKTRASIDMELFDKVVEADEHATKSGKPFLKYDDTQPPEPFAPFIAYLASDAAAHVTGSVFMTMGGFIGRWANPAFEATMFNADGWTVDKVIETAPTTLFKDYKNINQKD